MKTRIADEDVSAERLIPPTTPDGSGIGVNYVDAYIKPINIETEDGLKITCKRKGLKITMTVGGKTGEAIIRRVDHGPDVRNMLRRALESAALEAGAQFRVEEGVICIES